MRQQAWADYRADVADNLRMEWKLQQAEQQDHRAAVQSGELDGYEGMSEWVHVLLCFLTAGLWLPVLVYVLIRNRRRERRTSVGRNDQARRREAKVQLQQRRKERNDAFKRGDHQRPVTPYAAAPVPQLRPVSLDARTEQMPARFDSRRG